MQKTIQTATVLVTVLGLSGLATGQQSPMISGMVEATGFGTVDMTKVRSKVQAKLMARRAAKVDAQRALLEEIDGVRITSGTTVKDAQLESDLIATRVKGMLRGAFTLNESTTEEDGNFIAEVQLAVCVNSKPEQCQRKPTLSQVVFGSLEKTPPAEQFQEADAAALPAAPVQRGDSGVHSGLIIDVSSHQFSPYLDVRVKTAGGKELYGPGSYNQELGGDWLHWAKSVDAARAMAVIGDSPLVIAATGTADDSDIIVADGDAVQIFETNLRSGDFLKQGKVVFVIQ